jgi:hypothetical protein
MSELHMSDKRSKPAKELTERLVRMDERAIDELYGLEPVYRPDQEVGDGLQATIFVSVSCPYCNESYDTQVDLTAGSFTYIEDCQVCCQPMELFVEVDSVGHLRTVNAQRTD